MKAARIHQFGGPEVIAIEDLPIPQPQDGELLIRIFAAGVGPWDAWIRAGKSALPQPLPLTLGADIAGTVVSTDAVTFGHPTTGAAAIAPRHSADTPLAPGDEVYGVANARFTNGYAEYAAVSTTMIARKPRNLNFIEAASVPVVAVTAWQMLFQHAALKPGQRVLIHGALGNVGSYAVQLARSAGITVVATARPGEEQEIKQFGAEDTISATSPPDYRKHHPVDAVIDTVGGTTQDALFAFLKPGGALVSAVSQPNQTLAAKHTVRAAFILVDVNTRDLETISNLIDSGKLITRIGEVLPLASVRDAHAMLDGTLTHPTGKIVLDLTVP